MAEQGPFSNQNLSGKYLLGALLGEGGSGVVYQARHLLLNRQQAIKILLPHHFTNPKFRQRFLLEAQTLATFDHPNIVHVDDFGVEGTLAYLVMPYISKGTLQSILKQQGALPLAVVARYLKQICSALDYAHARNVAHLDLKPLNLLLHDDGQLLLSDFGLARLVEQGAIQGGTSLLQGTPHYMAPEHWSGTPGPQSDLYALGVMLYQMLTGHLPFDADGVLAIGYRHATQQHPPLRASRPELPETLDAVLSKVLAKKPEGRYHLASDLWADFQTTLETSASSSMTTQVMTIAATHEGREFLSKVAEADRRDSSRSSRISITAFQHYLHGVRFPATREQLLAQAQKNNAPPNMIARLEELDENYKFHNASDVMMGYAYHRYLHGVRYPATRTHLLEHARKNEAPSKFLSRLQALSETDVFANPEAVMRSSRPEYEEKVEALAGEEVLLTAPTLIPESRRSSANPVRVTEFAHYLHGVRYPATNMQLLEVARRNNAPPNMIARLEELPEQVFASASEVMRRFAQRA